MWFYKFKKLYNWITSNKYFILLTKKLILLIKLGIFEFNYLNLPLPTWNAL